MKLKSRLAGAALIATLALPLSAMLPSGLSLAPASAQAGIVATHEATLASYGSFYDHPKYGKVWAPSASVAPQGWHPYQPCHWVNTKYGWYFQDNTAWGAIVHHYGRWTHEPKLGWIWVPGEEFSPGWVIWRTSEQWVGWAPTPADQDIKTLDADEFNSDKMWIFMEAQKFGKACGGDVVASASQVPVLLTQTKYVKDFIFVDGILVFVLPPWIWGPIVDINIGIGVWSPVFITTIINNWINVWNVVNINVACGPLPMPAIKPIQSNPPPPPAGRRAENPPTINNPGGNPGDNLRPIDPPNLRPIPTGPVNPVKPIDPPNFRPIATGPVNPTKPIDPPNFRPIGTGPVNPIKPIDPPNFRPIATGPVNPIKPINPPNFRPTKPVNPITTINAPARTMISNKPSMVSSGVSVKLGGGQQVAGPGRNMQRRGFM